MDELQALTILNNTPFLGSVKIRLLVSVFGSAVEALDATAESLYELPGFGRKAIDSLLNWKNHSDWEKDLEAVNKFGIDQISYLDPRFPKRLLEIADHPILLYLKGSIVKCDEQAIGVIGTRFATIYGKEMAERISEELTTYGYTVVSGLARGIDTAAHEGALKRGRTIGVLGCGLLHMYPKENARLAEKIAENGALVSEFPMHSPPDRQHFPQRNRIVSGMSQALLLVEAPLQSGAMITMDKGHHHQRRLFALPGRADVESFKGNHQLIKQRVAELVESGKEIVEALGSLFSHHRLVEPVKHFTPPLEAEEAALLSSLSNEEMAIDDIAKLTKQPMMKLNVLLMSLVLKKQIREFPGKIFKRV